jgi:flagellar biogenesis protein FliO
MKRREASNPRFSTPPIQGWAGWLIGRLRTSSRCQPRLRLVERIALAPRQSLSLVEAEGRRFLVATATDGAPVFYPLEGPNLSSGRLNRADSTAPARPSAARVSW